MTFAVIKTGGKQYIVKEGQVLTVEKLVHEGDKVTFDEVLLVADLPDGKAGEKKAAIGQPLVKGAKVTATVLEEGKGEKKIVFRYKAKTRYHKKKGHRQLFTKVKITKITA
jgi:large subunit ribosomal protein L21